MFGFGKNKFLGIDIGTSSIKIAEIKIKDNKPILSNYAWMRLAGKAKARDFKSSSFTTFLPEYLKRIIKEARFKSKNAYVSIPAFGGLIMLIEFPQMAKNELDQAIKFEAHKYIPTSLDEVVLSWDVVNRKNSSRLMKKSEGNSAVSPESFSSSDKMQVLLVAAPKERIAKYEKLFSEVNLKLKAIEIESFSLVRSLVGNDPGNFVIVDIGERVCNIILVEKGIIKVNRNIDAGGRDITQVIAKSMDVDEGKAEKLKTSGKEFLGKESSLTFSVLDLIIGEIKRVLSAYYKNETESKVDAVILSGGSANFKGLREYFSNDLNLKTIIGNPLGRIGYDSRLGPKLKEIQTQFSVAIGLALKGVEEYLKK